MTIIIACDNNYYKKACEHGLFHSLNKNWSYRVCVLLIGKLDEGLELQYNDKFEYAFCALDHISTYRKGWPSNREFFVCAEGEDFSKWFKLDDDELIIHLDADMIMQRRLTQYELNQLIEIEEGEVGMSFSAFPAVSLREEVYKLKPRRGYDKINKDFEGNLGWITISCTGMIVAKANTYRELSKYYIQEFDKMIGNFDHHAGGQWLLNYIVKRYGFNLIDLGNRIHNASWFIDTLTEEKNDQLYYLDSLVAFNHTKFNKMYRYE